MTKDELLAKQQEASDKYDALRVEIQERQDEQKRLQGVYSAYQELLDSPDPALTIDADKTLDKEKSRGKGK